MSFGWSEYIRDNQRFRLAQSKAIMATSETIKKIKKYDRTKRIRYPEYKEAFDYVHNLYPNVNVRQAYVYHTTKPFLEDIGMYNIGGFYSPYDKVVVITNQLDEDVFDEFAINTQFDLDEVLCHELIHFASNAKLPCLDRVVEEEIAYTKSIGYLRNKGRSDDFIVEKNFLPFLMSIVDRSDVYKTVLLREYKEEDLSTASCELIEEILKPLADEVFNEIKKRAIELGHKVIRDYDTDPLDVDQCQIIKKQYILDEF